MSGGSMDYLYSKVESGASDFVPSTPERKALREHMLKLATALRAVEWNDSGDGARDEAELILACVGGGAVLEAALVDAKRALQDLQQAVLNAEDRAWRGR